MKPEHLKSKIVIVTLAAAVAVFVVLGTTEGGRHAISVLAQTFSGPGSCAAGQCQGALGVNSTNNIGVGGSAVGSSRLFVYTTTSAYSAITASGTIYSTAGGFKFPDNTVQTTAYLAGSGLASTSAPNVSAGQFGANTSGGNFSFPASLGIGTTQFTSASGELVMGYGKYLRAVRSALDDTRRLIGFDTNSAINTVTIAPDGNPVVFGSGNVGIGTTNPSAKLDVNGTVSTTAIRFPDGTTQSSAASASPWTRQTGITYLVNTGDLVGIGTSTPSNPLTIYAPAGYYAANIGNDAAAGTSYGVYVHAGGNTSDYSLRVRDRSAATEYFAIRGDGNVGVGTASPDAKFQVNGDLDVTGNKIYLSKASNNTGIQYGGGDTGQVLLYGGSTLSATFGANGITFAPTVTANGINASGNLVFAQPSGGRNQGIVGTYDASHLAAIWSMGSSYQLDAAGITGGALYGLSYSYEPDYGGAGNNSGAASGLGHQMQWRAAGVTQTAIGSGIYTAGHISQATGAYIYPGYLAGGSDGSGRNLSYYLTGSTRYGLYSNTSLNIQAELLIGGLNAVQGSDSWLRLNNGGSFSSGVYTPGLFRADGGVQAYGGIAMGNTKVTGLATPTASTDAATKAYVDSASAVQFMGITSAVYTGNLGGPLGANAKCQLQYSGSHMCTQSEIIRSGVTSLAAYSWVLCDVKHGDICDGPTYSITNTVGQGSVETSCAQFTSAYGPAQGPVLNPNTVGGVDSGFSCANSFGIACCK